MTHAIVLLSGGLDSTTVAAYALAKNYTLRGLSIRYGQRHVRELESARRVAQALGIPLLEADAGFYAGLANYSALTDPQREVPLDRDPASMSLSVPITYVPLRNTLFVTLAAAALESWMLTLIEDESVPPEGLDPVILVGANAIDYSGYPDCRPEFYDAIAEVLRLGSKIGTAYDLPIRIEAPIITMTKPEIVRLSLEHRAPLELTWSCYTGGEHPCDACDSCELRAAAFAGAGVADPALARG
jgi:7-cyano-7-deazaguanine synthase